MVGSQVEWTLDLQRFADGDLGQAAPPSGSGDPSGQAAGAGSGSSDPSSDATGSQDGGTGTDIEALQREIKKLRNEAAQHRISKKQAEEQLEKLKKAVAQALGLEETFDADKAKDQLQTLTRRLRDERVRNTFYRHAARAGVDIELAWGYLLASGDLENLDPDAQDFEEQLKGALDEAVKAKPGLKAQGTAPPPPPVSGGNPPRNTNATDEERQKFIQSVMERQGLLKPPTQEKRSLWKPIGRRNP